MDALSAQLDARLAAVALAGALLSALPRLLPPDGDERAAPVLHGTCASNDAQPGSHSEPAAPPDSTWLSLTAAAAATFAAAVDPSATGPRPRQPAAAPAAAASPPASKKRRCSPPAAASSQPAPAAPAPAGGVPGCQPTPGAAVSLEAAASLCRVELKALVHAAAVAGSRPAAAEIRRRLLAAVAAAEGSRG